MLKNCFKVYSIPFLANISLLVLRLIVGIAFLYHGYGKILNPFGWMPADAPVPGFFQFLAALSEFGGGACLILGLLIPLSMLGLASTMAVAVSMHAFVMGDPFVNMTGGSSYELALVYFGISLMFITLGPGKISLDAIIFGSKK